MEEYGIKNQYKFVKQKNIRRFGKNDSDKFLDYLLYTDIMETSKITQCTFGGNICGEFPL